MQEHQLSLGIAPTPLVTTYATPKHIGVEGFVWALVILGAARLGRKQAEDSFLDYDALRVRACLQSANDWLPILMTQSPADLHGVVKCIAHCWRLALLQCYLGKTAISFRQSMCSTNHF